MSAYVIVNVETSSPERYEEYKRMAQETVAQFGGCYLVRGGKMTIVEGGWKPTRIVVLEFDSFEKAIEWWESSAYSPAKALRRSISKADIVIVEGYDDGTC
jgi:uncharacterized protein (DUF1330 family)